MSDHRWLSLAQHLFEWPDAEGGFVVTRGGSLVIASHLFADVASDCVDATLYVVTAVEVWNEGDLDELARIVVPRGAPPIFGVDLEIELDEVSL